MDKFSLFLMRRQLTLLVHSLRRSVVPLEANLAVPKSAKDDYILYGNKILRRKRIVLFAPACSVASCTMCPLPNEAADSLYHHIRIEDMMTQFNNSFPKGIINDYDMVTLYTNGNFFSDREISPNLRRFFYEKIRDSKVKYLTVESLPQFITSSKVEEVKNYLGSKKLVVTIGLQSVNKEIRELAINSSCTLSSFENAYRMLQKYNYQVIPFLMVKPPFVTEEEAIIDVRKSIKYLHDLGINNTSLCATRVAHNTLLYLLYQDGKYRPPRLWTLREILIRSKQLGSNIFPRIVTSEFRNELNPDSICVTNCDECNDKLIKLFDQLNNSKDFFPLEKFNCGCFKGYKKYILDERKIWGDLSIPDRIALFLESHRNLLN